MLDKARELIALLDSEGCNAVPLRILIHELKARLTRFNSTLEVRRRVHVVESLFNKLQAVITEKQRMGTTGQEHIDRVIDHLTVLAVCHAMNPSCLCHECLQ